MTTKYHILLLGGTGLCGLIFTRAALEAGHRITAYVRSPSKIPYDLSSNSNLSILQGSLGDKEGLKKAAACGANVFVSLAGPTLGKREGLPITDALIVLYPLLLIAGTYNRVLVLSTPSYSAPEDSRSVKWFFAINFYIRVIGGDTYNEIRGIAQQTVALGREIEWTVFRVPLLQGKELVGAEEFKTVEDEVYASFVGDKEGHDGLQLERSRLVRWILREMEEKKWVGLCPMLSNA